ncbi:cytochrome P450 [Sistotremastrum suecicum HHB10207 ss-3]|uniref:Cytochrome P450 n=1 Tax=Sistotremastrum suecicum HHB10207 ss-3 TaxID=1314776 RepID=A0A166H569_9AGAM|nr:cytochrome P450 [Sistotremastrum suecicum HHB10207 ss-3]
MIFKGALLVVVLFLGYHFYKLIHRLFIAPLSSHLGDLPGPKPKSLIWGSFKEINDAGPGELHAKWVEEYGPTMSYKGVLNSGRFYTHDTRAVSYVLSHTEIFRKPEQIQFVLGRILGKGVLFAEGEDHKHQRRLLNPAFSNQHIRELTEVFFTKALELRDTWHTQALEAAESSDSTSASSPTSSPASININAVSWLSRVTLDIIGLAGFDYAFNATNPQGTDDGGLQKAFKTAFSGVARFDAWGLLVAWFPVLRKVPTKREREVREAQATMRRIGKKLIADKKKAILESIGKDGKVEEKSVEGKDILSILIRANMATDLPESARLSEEDVLAQVPTFIVAGHETTATATTWFLYAMTQHPSIQSKLRAELRTVDTDTPSMDVLNALPYLDGVVRETLRYFSIVPSTLRIAAEDCVVPLKNPVVDRYGKTLTEVRLKKGEGVNVPIISLNRSKEIWGEDAAEYRPERWEKVPEIAHEVPGVWGDLMTFIGGPRSCIGYKFSVIEMKALIFTLIRAFSFELSDPTLEIYGKTSIVTRPLVRGQEEKGNQMPLKVSLVGGI